MWMKGLEIMKDNFIMNFLFVEISEPIRKFKRLSGNVLANVPS